MRLPIRYVQFKRILYFTLSLTVCIHSIFVFSLWNISGIGSNVSGVAGINVNGTIENTTCHRIFSRPFYQPNLSTWHYSLEKKRTMIRQDKNISETRK